MTTQHADLARRAFGPEAGPLTTVAYLSYQQALQFLLSALSHSNGIGLLHGPAGSGRTTIARNLAAKLAHDTAVAFIDGNRLKPPQLLKGVLKQFEVEAGDEPEDELVRLLAGFAGQQASTYQAPVVIVDNVDCMYPSTLRALNALAALEAKGRHALRLVLTGGAALTSLVRSAGMQHVGRRDPGMYLAKPLSAKETMIYLHARLQAAGSDRADTVFPFDVCDRLREQSEGWPGPLNQFALEAMGRADNLPVSVVDTCAPQDVTAEVGEETRRQLMAGKPEAHDDNIPTLSSDEAENEDMPAPRVVISRDGKRLGDYAFREKRVLIGRSDFADIVVEDEYVSKLHAILLLYSDALVLLDLNSANGTTVNSVKVSKTILRSNDIISLGHHRLKIENAPAITPEIESLLGAPDTLQLKNLLDLRRLRARRAMQALKGRKSG